LTAGAAAAGLSLLPRRARAGWGDAPETATDILLPPGQRAERCLEVFLYGGIASYHTFYAVEEYGRPDNPNPALQNTQYHQFADDKRTVWGQDCGAGSDSAAWLTPFERDSLGKMVNLTPAVQPLINRPDILDRMRVLVMQHDFQPHEIAIPYMLTGQRLGSPRLSGLGAHVQHYWSDRSGSRVVPYSFVLSPEGALPIYNIAAASAVGQHPGSARPLHIFTSAQTDISGLVGRTYLREEVGKVDSLLDYYAKRSSQRYQDASGVPLRSAAIADHQFAISSLINAPNLQSVLTPEMFTAGNTQTCGQSFAGDAANMTVEAAIALLTHASTPAKYVNVIDGGTRFYGDLPYDVHGGLVDTTTINLRNTLATIAAKINAPGENDPTKLDIEDTMIVINAEFGRAPVPQGADGPGGGSDHYPFGFVSVIIGGPIQRGVVGAIGPDGSASEYLTPSEFRAATLAALGIYPFSPQSFAVGDIRDVPTEADGLAWLNEHVLGRTA
jgi:hypothetical protein